MIDRFPFSKHALNNRLKLIGTGIVAVIAIAIIVGLTVEIPRYLRHRELKQFGAICNTVIFLQSAKWQLFSSRSTNSAPNKEFAFLADLTNGYPVKWSDLESFVNGHSLITVSNISQLNVCGEKYILNPIGTSIEAQLPSPMCGYAVETRVSLEFVEILEKLQRIEVEKEDKKWDKEMPNTISLETYRRWKKSRIIMADKIDFGGLKCDDQYAIYILNPPGVLPTARLKKAIPGFPAGTEISLPLGSSEPWWY